MKAEQKQFTVTIELSTVEFYITAKNKTDARKKALAKLSKKNPKTLIAKAYPSGRKDIYIDEY